MPNVLAFLPAEVDREGINKAMAPRTMRETQSRSMKRSIPSLIPSEARWNPIPYAIKQFQIQIQFQLQFGFGLRN